MPRPDEIKVAYEALVEKKEHLQGDVALLKANVDEWQTRLKAANDELDSVQEAIKSLDDNIPDNESTPMEDVPNAS